MKTCNKCKIEKHTSEFHNSFTAKDGLQPYCKVCRREHDESLKALPKTPVAPKVCTKCGVEKQPSEFYNNSRTRDGLSTQCGPCLLEAQNNKNRENPKRSMTQRAKTRASKAGVSFSITEDCFEIPEYCPVLGIKLEHSRGSKGYEDNSPSLDRIKPELGYVPGNVAIISMRANRLKNDGTLEEFRKLVKWLEAQEASGCP